MANRSNECIRSEGAKGRSSDKTMDFFDHPRYVINKQLFKIIGLWPYQDKNEKRLIIFTMAILSASTWIGQIRKLIIDRDNPAVILESIPPIMIHFGVGIKLSTCLFNVGKMTQLLKRMIDDWNEPMGMEAKVLERFADDGRIFTIAYSVVIYISMTVFLIVPFAPKIIVAFGWLNISTEAQFCIPIDYFVDSDEYFFYIQMHLIISITLAITIYIAVDVMFIVFVQHASGLFSTLGYRIEHLIDNQDLDVDLHPPRSSDKAYWTVVDCIKKHNKAAERIEDHHSNLIATSYNLSSFGNCSKPFADDLNDMYSTAFLFMMGLNIPGLSITGLQVIFGMNKRMGVAESIRQGLLTGSELMHLFFEFYFSQRLTDHSFRVLGALFKAKWYKTSMRTRKLLSFMMMRSMIPSELKVGKLYTLSMENFSSVIRASVSYFTLLCSLQ